MKDNWYVRNAGKRNVETNSGIGILSLLGLLFIGLKLTNYVNWSWWWVLAPFWAPPALLVLFFLLWVFAMLVWAK